MRHKVANGFCGIAHTEREHYQGTLDEAFWGERLSVGKLRHDIGEREGEAAQVLLGWSGSQEGTELALCPLIIEAEELVAPGGTGHKCVLLVLSALGLQWGLETSERGRGSQVSGGRSERVLRARLSLSHVLVSCSCV